MAQAGFGLEEISDRVKALVNQVDMLVLFNTAKYLTQSGRVNNLLLTAASMLNIRLLMKFRDGEIVRSGIARTFDRGMGKLYDFVKGKNDIKELIIVHSMVPEEAEHLRKRMAGFVSEDKITISHMGAGLGVHGGPGVLLVSIRQGDSQ